MAITTLRTTAPGAISTPAILPTSVLSEAEKAIFAMPGLVAWLEADQGVQTTRGFRWQLRNRLALAFPMERYPPVLRTGFNGLPSLRMGYGDARFTSTERGAMLLPNDPVFSALGYSNFTVVQIPPPPVTAVDPVTGLTVVTSENPLTGGYVWSASGPATTATPRVIITRNSGIPSMNGGGKTIGNPAPNFDMRDAKPHLLSCNLDSIGGGMRMAIDRARSVGSATAATVVIDPAARFGVLGRFATASDQPLYGEIQAHIAFDRPDTAPIRAAVENYLAAKYGVTLV